MAICACAVVRETTKSTETIYVLGDVDENNARQLNDVLVQTLAGLRPITVDLTRCRYIGSLGLRTLLRAKRQAPGFTTIVDGDSMVARLLEMAKLEERLNVRRASSVRADILEDTGEQASVIELEGEWDLSRGNELRRKIDRALAHPRVVLDLSRVTYIDSYCVGMLVRLRTQRVAKGYEPSHVVIAPGNVRRVFGLVDPHDLWPLYGSVEEALADWK